MKRFLLACCLLALTCSVTFAQHAAPTSVPKTQFVTEAGKLNTLIGSHKMDDAKTQFESVVHQMMMTSMAVTKSKIFDAKQAHNEADEKKYMDVMIKQREIYSAALQYARGDMASNKKALNDKLAEFSTTLQ